MLPKSSRLGGREGFESVFRSKRVIFGQEIALFFRSGVPKVTRIGFAFKQKSFPKATERHFLKRKGSAIMRGCQKNLPSGIDVVVLFHRPFRERVTYRTLEGALSQLIDRLKKAK